LQIVGGLTIFAVAAVTIMMLVMGQWLQYRPTLEKADYLVPLAGEDNRLITAVDLYKQGYAPTILLSDSYVQPPTRSETIAGEVGHPYVHPYVLRREILDHLGVPQAATAEFGNGHISTTSEAESLRQFVGDRAVSVILVTSPFHARRASIIFRHIMPKARFVVAVTPEYRLADPWWSTQESALLTTSEVMKLTFYWLGGAFRSGAPTK
jgi:uncharacterized SAM-binding protein YcdF (DUF218 family)